MLNNRTLIGIILVALGLVLLLDRAGTIDAGTLIGRWWPAILLVSSVLALVDRPPRPAAAGVLATVGVALLSIATGPVGASALRVLGPVALIAIGLLFVSGRRAQPSRVDSGDTVNATAGFCGNELASTSAHFEDGTLTAAFGGVETKTAPRPADAPGPRSAVR